MPLNKSPQTRIPSRVLFKIHRRGNTEILAICDESLLGQDLVNNRSKMHVSEKFYRGQRIPIEDALDLMRRYYNINAVGSVIELGLKQKTINKDAILWFQDSEGKNIPHLLIFSIPPI